MSSKAKATATPINQPRKRELSPRPHEGLKPTQAELAYLLSDMLTNTAHDSDLELVIQGALAHYHRSRFESVSGGKGAQDYAQKHWKDNLDNLKDEWTGRKVTLRDLKEVDSKELTSLALFHSRLQEQLARRFSDVLEVVSERPEDAWVLNEILSDYDGGDELMEAVARCTDAAGYVAVPRKRYIKPVKDFLALLESMDAEQEKALAKAV